MAPVYHHYTLTHILRRLVCTLITSGKNFLNKQEKASFLFDRKFRAVLSPQVRLAGFKDIKYFYFTKDKKVAKKREEKVIKEEKKLV